MIFLQCVGSVCRSRKRASYLQGGSEMIMRKKNNRKTKSSGHQALSLSWFFFEYVANIIWEEGGGSSVRPGKKDVQWQLSVTGSQVVLTEAQLLKLCLPKKPACCRNENIKLSWHREHILIIEHSLLKESHPSGCFIELWPWALVLSHLLW